MTRFGQLRTAVRHAFAGPTGWIAAAGGALFVVLITVALVNARLLAFIFGESGFSAGLKLRSAAQVLWGGRLIFTYPGGWLALVLAALFGLNLALIIHYMRHQVEVNRAAGASLIGIVVGLLGVGCAACGSVLLSALIGAGSTVGGIGLLPMHGQEFAWLGVIITALATFSIAGKIASPAACRIPRKR